MYYRSNIVTKKTGAQIIKNFKEQLKQMCAEVGQGREVGILNPAKGFLLQIDAAVANYGERVVGTALEELRREKPITDRSLYYAGREDEAVDESQDDFVEDFTDTLEEYCIGFEEEVREIEAEEEERRREKEDIKNEYKRIRKNLQARNRRRGKPLNIPKIPKRITEGSIRRLVRLMGKLK